MKKLILNPSMCIDEIETIIKKHGWEIVDKKYDFYQPYISTFDSLNYEAKIDLYIAFKSTGNFIHKFYCYFLAFDSDNIFKISEIKSPEHPNGQMTTRVAEFKHYRTTGNLGFNLYKSPVFGQAYNLSHNYHSFFNSLIANEANNELNYVCILLKYDNHARNKKMLRYYVNSYKKFIKSFLLKGKKFETRKTRALKKISKKTNKKSKKINLKKNINNSTNAANKINKQAVIKNSNASFDDKKLTVKVVSKQQAKNKNHPSKVKSSRKKVMTNNKN